MSICECVKSLLDSNLDAIVTCLHDGDGASGEVGGEGGGAIRSGGGVYQRAACGVDRNLGALVKSAEGDHAALALDEHGLGGDGEDAVGITLLYGLYRPEATPWSGILVFVHRAGRHMQGGIFDIGVVEGIGICRGHRRCMAVHIGEAGAIKENPISNARHALGDGNGGEAGATIESPVSNDRHTLGEGDGGEVVATIESTVSNPRHALGDGDGGEAAAIIESIDSDARHALGDNGGSAALNQGIAVGLYDGIAVTTRIIDLVSLCNNDGGEAAATKESPVSNVRHALRDGDGGEAAATRESTASNARHALGDGDGGEAAAIRESSDSNARHALGDGDGGEAAATPESSASNARHALGDNGGSAALNQGIAVGFYDGIAVTTRIIDLVSLCNNDGGEAAATIESTLSNARHAPGDGDGGEAAATIESTVSNTRHALRDGDVGEADATIESTVSDARHALGEGDGGEAAAIRESMFSNARHALGDGDGGKADAIHESIVSNPRHAIRHAVVGDGGGDGDGAGVPHALKGVISLEGHLGLACLSGEVIPDAADLDFLCTGHEGQQGGEKQ